MDANYHTHTRFCDGKDSPAELAEAALALGLEALGFSGHSYTAFDGFGMTPEKEKAYRAEVARLREQYAGRLEITCGIEQDCYSAARTPGYDYAIGSVHSIARDGAYLCVDWSPERSRENIDKHYGGDPYAYAEDYYALVGRLPELTGCQIIGHFDLIRKFDEDGSFFDTEHPRYRAAVQAALDRLCTHGGLIFEINTGAMARGWRSAPFPSLDILKDLRRRHAPIVIGSDCHDRAKLNCGWDLAVDLARQAGYRTRLVLLRGRWQARAL